VRKCAAATGLISNSASNTLAEAVCRLVHEKDAKSVADAMKILARFKIMADAENTPVGRA
jgi:hypothetical protein